jgi:hypothetical protein
MLSRPLWSRPVALVAQRWLTAPPTRIENPTSAVVTAASQASRIEKNAPSGALSAGDDNDLRWSRVVLPALEAFAQIHGHCIVRQQFVVPSSSPWPNDSWGFKLGICVSMMRIRRSFSSQTQRDAARLEAIDFVWDVNEYKWTERILPALTAFAAKFGHCELPASFVVPSDPAWPKRAWKLNLGKCVHNIRVLDIFNKQTQRDAAQLEAIGFVWGSREHRWNTIILPALEAFAAEHGHCEVPIAFIVPSTSPWPREAWGLKLGNCVGSIRSNGNYAAQTERDAARLEAIDFVWRWDEYQWARRIMPSLEVFHRLEGHSDVPIKFVVPSESPWPESAWGLKLGHVVNGIRHKGTYAKFVARDAGHLSELGLAA